MKNTTPRSKLSKRARRALDAQSRSTWGDIRPTTRVKQSAKLYSRKKNPRPNQDGDFS